MGRRESREMAKQMAYRVWCSEELENGRDEGFQFSEAKESREMWLKE